MNTSSAYPPHTRRPPAAQATPLPCLPWGTPHLPPPHPWSCLAQSPLWEPAKTSARKTLAPRPREVKRVEVSLLRHQRGVTSFSAPYLQRGATILGPRCQGMKTRMRLLYRGSTTPRSATGRGSSRRGYGGTSRGRPELPLGASWRTRGSLDGPSVRAPRQVPTRSVLDT